MEKEIQYKVYIGYNDQQTKQEIVCDEEITTAISNYFNFNKINFSLNMTDGMYISNDFSVIQENSLCITFVGDQDFDIYKFSKGLSMLLNQESLLITKEAVNYEYK